MKIKKLVSVLVVCLLIVATYTLCGCTREPKQPTEPEQPELAYNAKIIVDINEPERRILPIYRMGFTDEFWTENMVRVIYRNEDYDRNSPDSEEYLFDEMLPEEITHIITTEEQYRHIFNNEYVNAYPIDFEKEMLIVYIGVGGSNRRTYLWEVVSEDKELLIKYKIKPTSNQNMTSPERHVLAIRMDRLDIETVQFQSLGRI